MNPNGSSNFCTAVRGRQIMAARAAARDAEDAAYNEAAVATGAAIGYLNCVAKNYDDLLVARRDMLNTACTPTSPPTKSPKVIH
ncbi:hypothetical protein A2U01_0005557 [Trifolium medium]|uniref:Uncharacterized protein n=1 Tax=Trifolium medium TaxID=97028 RepID=A0A392MB49_9FABA|nr:hypothetical protein [Trifolium medium]